LKVYRIAADFDAAMRQKAGKELIPDILTLSEALKAAVDVIQQFDIQTAKDEIPKKLMDLSELERIFTCILAGFDQFNPDEAECLLPELQNYLTQDQIKPIQKYIDRFDFDCAREETLKLMKELGIKK